VQQQQKKLSAKKSISQRAFEDKDVTLYTSLHLDSVGTCGTVEQPEKRKMKSLFNIARNHYYKYIILNYGQINPIKGEEGQPHAAA